MSALNIPRAAVDKAARQIHTRFDDAAPIEQHNARETAMAALNDSAPPLVAVELLQLLKVLTQELQDAPPPNFEENNYDAGFIAGLSRAIDLVQSRVSELDGA